MTYLFFILVLSPLFILGLFRLFFNLNSPEKIMHKYSGNSTTALQKKYPEADIQSFRSVFLKIGVVFTLLLSLYAFNYAQRAGEVKPLSGNLVIDDNIEVLPPVTKAPPVVTPPPPPPAIEIVADEEILEAEPDLTNLEANENTVIEPNEPAVVTPAVMPQKVVEPPKKATETPEEPEIFIIVEDMPEYPGGQNALFKFLAENTHYPAMARENGIEGTVYVGFVVMEDGSISNVQIKRGLPGGGAGCDEEALRVVKQMPKWKAGKQRGKKVRVAYTLPFKFKLS